MVRSSNTLSDPRMAGKYLRIARDVENLLKKTRKDTKEEFSYDGRVLNLTQHERELIVADISKLKRALQELQLLAAQPTVDKSKLMPALEGITAVIKLRETELTKESEEAQKVNELRALHQKLIQMIGTVETEVVEAEPVKKKKFLGLFG